MDRLPNVFQNPINKKFENVQDLYRSDKNVIVSNPKDVNTKINQIFGSLNHVYKSRVKITTKNGITEEEIVGKTNVNLLTLNGKLIKITDIIDIEKA